MSRTAAIVAALASGALASAINVCATQDILNFRDFEPAKEYCAPHYPAQTIISTALPRCLTTTKTNIVATSTVIATKVLSCPAEALSEVDQGEVPLQKRDPEAFGGWGNGWAGGWGGGGGGWGGSGGEGGGWGGPPSWPWWGEGQEHSSSGSGSGSGSGESSAQPWWEHEPWWQHGGYGEPWWQQGGSGSGSGDQPWWVHPGQGGGQQGGSGQGGHHEGGHGGEGKHHRKHFHHAKRCGSSGECGSGEQCYRDQHQWWHDENGHWWYGGQKGGSQGHCVPPKHHQNPHPAPPPCPWHPKPTGNPTHPNPQPHPKPTGYPWHPNPPHQPTNPPHYPTKPPHYPTHPNSPPPYYSHSSSSSYPESLSPIPTYYHKRDVPTPVKRDNILETVSAWQQVSSSLLQCGYQCIQRACSCIAATTVEYHTPAPTCTETKTKATILHVTSTMEVMPEHCEHNDIRKA